MIIDVLYYKIIFLIIPKLISATIVADINTPQQIEIKLLFQSNPSNQANIVPVHTPVNGNGTATINIRPKNP